MGCGFPSSNKQFRGEIHTFCLKLIHLHLKTHFCKLKKRKIQSESYEKSKLVSQISANLQTQSTNLRIICIIVYIPVFVLFSFIYGGIEQINWSLQVTTVQQKFENPCHNLL